MTEKHGVQSFVLLQLTLASRSQDCIQVRDRMFQCSDGREQIPSLAGGDWPDIEEEVRGHDNTDDKRSRRKKNEEDEGEGEDIVKLIQTPRKAVFSIHRLGCCRPSAGS